MDLPEGTVTFLFTDVEGSTRLWDLFPDIMPGAMTRHEEILRSTIGQYGGIVIKSTGDGLFSVFSTPTDAVQSALACQRDLSAEIWNPKTGRLKVRMALHTGTAELRGGDYYGGAVNRADRLLAAGHGDQILLSQSTRDLIREELPADVSLVDLGYHKLKDLLRPEHIYQLNVPDLPGSFPVLRGLDPRSVNLPSQPTPFVGRVEEIKGIRLLLENPDVRLVTIIGPGGTGKTRLAVQAAADFIADYADGTFFIDLTSLSETDLIPAAVANVLGVRESVDWSIEENVCQFLRARSILLILDNFEQVLDGANFVSTIIGEAPGVKVIVTSREVLALEEEWQFPLRGLPYPSRKDADSIADYDAIILFVNTAHRVKPDFVLEEQLDGVIDICQLVEGLPLAIELAAPWVKAMDADEIVFEIHRNISILSSRLRNLPERHQSLVAIFEQTWSYLSTRQRNALSALSIFRGGFQLNAAEEITGVSYNTILELVDKSILTWSSTRRFSIHELLRQHVERQLKLSPGDYLKARNIHCIYYANFVAKLQDEMFRENHLEAMERLEEDFENIRAAWEWAVAQLRLDEIQNISQGLYDLEDIKGRYIEVDQLINEVVEPLESIAESLQKDAVLAQIYLIRSWHSIRRGELDSAREDAERSRLLLDQHDLSPPPGFETDPLAALGVAANALGSYDQAKEFGEMAKERAESLEDSLKLQLSLNILSNAAYYQGDYQEARDLALEAKSIAIGLDSRWFLAYILSDLGRIDQVLGDYRSAKDNYRTTYKIRQDFDDPEGMALALNNLAHIALHEEDFNQAKQLFDQSRWLYLDIGDKGGLARSLGGLARRARLMDDFDDAGSFLLDALQISVEMGFAPFTLDLLAEGGELLLESSAPERGLQILAGVSAQPQISYETKEKVHELVNSIEDRFPEEVYKTTVEEGKLFDLNRLLAAVKSDLADYHWPQGPQNEPDISTNS